MQKSYNVSKIKRHANKKKKIEVKYQMWQRSK